MTLFIYVNNLSQDAFLYFVNKKSLAYILLYLNRSCISTVQYAHRRITDSYLNLETTELPSKTFTVQCRLGYSSTRFHVHQHIHGHFHQFS